MDVINMVAEKTMKHDIDAEMFVVEQCPFFKFLDTWFLVQNGSFTFTLRSPNEAAVCLGAINLRTKTRFVTPHGSQSELMRKILADLKGRLARFRQLQLQTGDACGTE